MREWVRGQIVLVGLVGLALIPAATAFAQSDEGAWEPVTEERLLDPEDGDWMSFRRTYDVTGFSPLDQIDRDNVEDLQIGRAHV